MTRACFESARACVEGATAFLGSPVVCPADFGVGPGVADDAVDCFFGFVGLDIEILRSVPGGLVPPPPKPHLGQQAGGAGPVETDRYVRNFDTLDAARASHHTLVGRLGAPDEIARPIDRRRLHSRLSRTSIEVAAHKRNPPKKECVRRVVQDPASQPSTHNRCEH